MQINEKLIYGDKPKRVIVFSNDRDCSLEFYIQKIMKKCIYFDYLVIYQKKKRGYYPSMYPVIYDNNFEMISANDRDYTFDKGIREYEKSPEYTQKIRAKKLERLLK